MAKRIGTSSVIFDHPASFIGEATIVGNMEKAGPRGEYFDHVIDDDLWGETTWEQAESKIYYEAVRMAVEQSGLTEEDIHLGLGGDLLNQLISAGFAARQMAFPFLGLYSACSTMSESLLVGAMAIDSGFADHVMCCVSSHFSTAERQFRTPLEQGVQRTPTAQRTITGAGACILSKAGGGPYITEATPGRVIDYGIKDANNMGAAMAPAAADTIYTHLTDHGREPSYYDAIYTGDLGIFGLSLCTELLAEKGMDVTSILHDCGAEMFHEDQDTHMGGSGAGCSAVMLNAYLVRQLREKNIRRLLFLATGALLSTVSTLQGESIPSVAHAVTIEMEV
ncbi:stage V sporulation protein AD [Eubacteriales bacterium OttesenSCG-928-M02]|nr:stage V sporulation protein AD [Eubacteriales bacterium OttesenSCG-928-M02]